MPDQGDIGGPDHNELIVALVAAVGTDITTVASEVTIGLDQYGYETVPVRLSSYLAEEAGKDFSSMPSDEGIWDAMSAGDELRNKWERGDALALHAISEIVATRQERAPDKEAEVPPPLDRVAFVLRSLKTQDELATLRAVYGPRLVVLAAYSPREARIAQLAKEIEASRGTSVTDTWVHQPEDLVSRDEKEEGSRGQDVSGTFHRADFFIRGSGQEEIREDLVRVLDILFGSPFRTPTPDEQGQYMAAGAALRSAEFGRQVGAAVATASGSVVSIGANEVPIAGGGSHWEGKEDGNRDFELAGVDTNRQQFEELAEKLATHVDGSVASLIEGGEDEDGRLSDLRNKLRHHLPDELREGGLKDLTEFGRAVHAEMNALLDAARRGVVVQDATLYTTTFPCHNCARHIVGAGIKRVVFIEPYTKSRAEQLHADSVAIAPVSPQAEKVNFEAFVGVAPRRYRELFDAASREQLGYPPRSQDGRAVEFDKRTAVPVFSDAGMAQFRPEAREYRAKELLALEHFEKHIDG